MLKQIVALLLLALLGACSDPPDPPLRVGTNVWPGYEPLYLARSLNFFNDRQVRLVEYHNASEVLRNFRNDTIEVAAVTLDEALLLHDHTPDIRIILGLDYSNGGDVLLAQPGIRTLAELKGRRVGVENTALGAYMLSLALESTGMFSSEVQIVPLTVDAHETAFKNKTVDAVVTFEPVKSRLLAAQAEPLFDSSQAPGKIMDVLVTREKYLTTRSRQIDLLINSWFRAVDYAQRNAADFSRRTAAREKIGEAEFTASLQGIHLLDARENHALFDPAQRRILMQVERLSGFMREHHLIESPIPGNIIFPQRFAAP